LNEQGKVKTVNPATEEVLNEYQIMTKQQINDKAKKARNAFDEWKKDNNKRMHNSRGERYLKNVTQQCKKF